jgi:hypothetical protein
LYLLIFAVVSMIYHISGAVALREEFFHASRYAREPFDFQDDGKLSKTFASLLTSREMG